jgi:hypothetical protein
MSILCRKGKWQMTSSDLKRWSGLAALVGGGLLVVFGFVEFLLLGNQPDSEAAASGAWLLVQGAYLVADMLVGLGLVGLYVRQAQEAGTLGLIGFVVAFVGGMMVAGVVWSEAFFGAWLAKAAPELLDADPTGVVIAGVLLSYGLFALGWLLFGWASLRAGVLPRGAAILLMIGAVLFALADLADLPFATVVIGVGLAWMGFALWSGSTARQPLITKPAT